jgi:hypothetical protein
MEQASSSRDGRAWVRQSSTCGGPLKKSYDLLEVYTDTGVPGASHEELAASAPEYMLISR